MAVNRELNWSKVLLAFLIAFFLFSFGIFMGYLGSKIIEGASIDILQSTNTEIVNLETIRLLEESYPCSSNALNIASDRLGYLTDLIDSMETQRGKSNKEVLALKKLYSAVEVRHMLLVKERAELCNSSYKPIMYFYSNKDECKDQTGAVSFILTYLRNKYDEVRVYSYDLNLESDVVQILVSNYNISGCYKVVIGNEVFDNIDKASDIEEYVKQK